MAREQTYRMELQYDGTGLHGWAKQPDCLTVEGCLEEAFARILGISPGLTVAGRTDAGVHARRQVVSLRLPGNVDTRRLQASLNALTPREVAVERIRQVRPGFDARRDAVSRTYRYQVSTAEVVSPFSAAYVWKVHGPLDLDAMRQAAGLVVGRHDFRAFTPTETKHVFFRQLVLRCLWTKQPRDGLMFEVEAQTFLRHMVRALVGTMIEIGRGKRTVDDLALLLGGGSREAAGVTAPAHGLFLWSIKY